MSAPVLTPADAPDGVPFYRTVPLWVLERANAVGIRNVDLASAKVMPKTAEVTSDSGETFKVRRADAFPGRS